MKQILFILCIVFTISTTNCQIIRQDHLLHATGSACLSGLTYCAVFKATNNITLSTVSSIGLTLTIGGLKEFHDIRKYNATWKQSGGDMLFNALGAFSSVYTIKWTFKGYKKPAKEFKPLKT
jgi:hypothetical protein